MRAKYTLVYFKLRSGLQKKLAYVFFHWNRKRVRSLARKCLEDRKNDPAALKSKKDLLNMMLQAEDPDTGKKMSEEEIISENVIFLVAGHETTAHCKSLSMKLKSYPASYCQAKSFR